MSSKDAEKLRKQAKAQLLAKYGRLMALYLTGKNGNFAGIPKEAKDLADSILSANDERSLRALYNVTKQLKTNSKKQMKDVPEMMGLPPPQRPVGDDYTSVVQSIPSITLSHHVLSQHKVDLYRKVKDDQGVVSFKKISSKQEKDDDTLEIKYGGTLGFRRTTEQIEEKDIKSKISLKKVDVPTWTKYFEDNKARLLESEKKWLKQRKGTLTGEEKRKCEQKLKAIDEILKQLKKDAKADAERKEKEAADKKKEEAKKSFQNALRGKIPLGECKFEGVVLGQLPDQDAVKVAIIETIDAIVSDESNPPFFINLDDSSLDQIKDVRDLQDKSLDYMLKNVYVIESEWGSATLDFKSKYQSEIDRKKAKPAAEALKVKTIKELEAKQEAEKKRREEAAALAAMKKRKEEAAKIKKLREDDLKKAAKAAELASKAEISPKPSAPPSDQMKQETKDDEPEDSGLSDPNSLYSRILRQQDEERRRMYADGGPGGEVPPSDCFDMVTVPNKGEHMARDQLELKQNSLTDVFGYTAEQNNIFKLLFLYALKHQYIKLNGVPLSQICWQDDKLKYISARTKGDLMELTRKDLKNVKLNMKKFRVVSDDFLERDELPILDDKQKSDFAAKTFPDKFNYVKVSDQGLKAKLSIDTKKYVTLEEAGKDIKWLFETAKDKGTKMNVYAFSRQKSQKQKVVGFYYPVVLIARKKQDKDTIDQKKFKFYYKNEKNENTKLIREEGYVWGTVDFSIYVQRSIVNPSTISTFAKPKRKKGKRRFTAPPAPRFVLEFEEGVTPALYSARVPEPHEL